MPNQVAATKLSPPERACLFKLEQQMVRQQGFINRHVFIDEQDAVFTQWEQEGHIELDESELKHLPQEQVEQQQLTHSCHLSEQLWIASACLRRIYACDL
ncbi:hypothetical protein SBW85_07500 [Vibrio plantisponsor]|uniref:Uncharacterized protein n=1 Tax=Vibrio plantisponsor TaxID=664643 RepID=A0ABU4IGE0_9VIBR|nr:MULTISPECIES: hypothetical protein [Vibrio]MCG6350559.1 hypothetical protein [Vibrio fluvialis]MCZ4371398.1 hypothetical protein [Vibrio diazotrophicus]MDW6017621.1 hypothetical protein [Vibrio plantisponsor]NNM40456.1 hypothetical protein [Vibrio plantisponsor]